MPNDHTLQIRPPTARELWVVGVAASLLTAAAFVVFYGAGIVTGSEVFFTHDIGGSDIWHLNYPLKHFYLEELAAGRLPLWCPQIGTGFPLLAEGQVGALYPPNLLLAPLPLVFAFNWGVLLHTMLAGAFTAGYARQLGSGRGGSFLAAIVFAYSGFFVTHIKHTNLTASAAYIPLLLLLLERFAARRTTFTIIMFAGATACMVLAGHPQIVFNNLLVGGFYASFLMIRIWLRNTGDNRGASQAIRFGAGMLSAVGLGLLLAMPQILPSLELYEVGPRRGGMTVESATEWEYHPKFLLAFIAPNVFGRPGEIRESTVKDLQAGLPATSPDGRRVLKLVGFDPGDVRMLYWEMTAYLGLLPLALALMAFALGYRRPVVWMLAAVLLASILLALGKHGGLFQIFWSVIPGFRLFRFQDRFLLYAALTLAVLAGLGFTWVVARIPWARRREMPAATIVMLVCLLDLFNALGGHNPKVDADRWSSPPPVADRIMEHAGRDPAPFRLTDTDGDRLVFVNAYYRARGWAGDLSPYDIARNMLHPNLNLLYGLTHHQVYFQLYPYWMHDASRLFYVPPRPDIAPEGGFKRIADVFNVRYVISPAGPAFTFDRRTGGPNPLDEASTKLPVIATFSGDRVESVLWMEDARPQPSEFKIVLHENRDAFPRAMLIPGGRVVPAPSSSPSLNPAQLKLLNPRFDPQREVLLHPDAGQPVIRETPPSDAIEAPVIFREYSPQRIRLAVTAPHRSWLFLSDTYYPGWKAKIDGVVRPIYRANICGRAVEVGAGRHEIIFDYAPESFRLGCGLAILGLLLIAGIGICAGRVNRLMA